MVPSETLFEDTDSFVVAPAQSGLAPLSLGGVLPGVGLAIAVAALAAGLHRLPVIAALSPMIIAIVIGIAFNNAVGTPAWAGPGLKFCVRRLLRVGVALLGLQLTLLQVREVGPVGLAIIATTVLATFTFTIWMGKLMGVDSKLARLIAGGTSICGASAVVATNAVTGASDEDVSYAIGSVTVFGSIAMLSYPLIARLLGLGNAAFGLWAGASIHEIAQVVAASFQYSPDAGEFGTIAKLSRVILLAPMTIGLGMFAARGARRKNSKAEAAKAPPAPWFVAGFLVLMTLNSVVTIPPSMRPWLVSGTAFLLSAALAAMGLDTDLRRLAKKGLRPAMLGAISFAFIASLSLILITLFL